jgi:Protein of unknown function (DUF2939)
MRKPLILLMLSVLLAALAYGAWPLWSAWQLRAAVKGRDVAAIERKVDWTTLRANLKRTIATNLRDESKTPGAGYFAKAFKRTLGPLVTDTLIDAAVRPRTLAYVLAGRLTADEIRREVAGGDASPRDPSEAEEISDPLPPRRLRWAFFETPTRFRFEFADHRDPAKRVVSIFALQGAGWKLVDVYYRTLAS